LVLHSLATGGYSSAHGQVRHGPDSAPSDVKLTIRTHGGQSVFQIGETIKLELLFTSTARKKYLVTEGYTLDRAAVEPLSGWDNPLGGFHQVCPVITAVSVLWSTLPLSAKPIIISLTLNDSVRFKEPGKYQITVESQRVGTANPKRLLTLNSNRLPLTIVPANPRWQDETLRNAVPVLDATASTLDLKPGQYDARWQAIDILRYLGTPEAARDLARQLKSDDLTFHERFLSALVESPARDAVLKEMEGLLADRDFPVDDHFLCAMSFVALGSDRTDQRATALRTLQARFRDELRSVLKNKQGRALQVSTATVDIVRRE
jgi:hypothetical protein